MSRRENPYAEELHISDKRVKYFLVYPIHRSLHLQVAKKAYLRWVLSQLVNSRKAIANNRSLILSIYD